MMMPKSYQRIAKKNNYPINIRVTHPFFISNAFIDFSELIWIFSIFFLIFENPFYR